MNPVVLADKILKYKPEEDLGNVQEDEILRSLYKMCRDLILYSVNDRISAFLLLLNFNSEEFSSELTRLQMRFIHFVKEDHANLKTDVTLLLYLGKNEKMTGVTRLECMSTLFKENYFSEAYDIAKEVSQDSTVKLAYRRDALFFLLGSETSSYILAAHEICKNMIKNGEPETSHELIGILLNIGSDENLYVTIMDLNMNHEYNEDMCVPLFLDFFFSDKYNIHHKILSAQFLIQTVWGGPSLPGRIKLLEGICDLAYSDDENITQGMRGDCGDFLIQWSDSQEYIAKGNTIINQIKFSNVPIAMQNIYTNKENVHDDNILLAINRFIVDRMVPNKDNIPPYDQNEVLKEISESIYKIKHESAKYDALDSFDRIVSDLTKFTQEKITSVQVICYIWMYVNGTKKVLAQEKKEGKNKKKELRNRFMQELVDMVDTCTSGHIGRLINVIEGSIGITFHQQIIANTQGRINAKLKLIKDEEVQGDFIMALMDGAEQSLKIKLNDWVNTFSKELRQELYEEFVDTEFIGTEDFEVAFNDGLKGWVL